MKKTLTSYLKPIQAGFTLIEVVLVIAIVGILAAGILSYLNPIVQIQKANDAKRKTDLKQLKSALELYYQDYGKYPANAVDYRLAPGGTAINWGASWSPYIASLPSDPKSNQRYVYYASSDGQSYWIYAALERGNQDSQVCNAGNACTSMTANGLSAVYCNSSGTNIVCNYGVSSTNQTP